MVEGLIPHNGGWLVQQLCNKGPRAAGQARPSIWTIQLLSWSARQGGNQETWHLATHHHSATDPWQVRVMQQLLSMRPIYVLQL
jgi:hypothetical protein